MERLTQQIAEFYETATPAQIRDTAAAAQTVMDAFLVREEQMQLRGLNSADPNDVAQYDLIENMSPADKQAYYEKVLSDMRLGTDP